MRRPLHGEGEVAWRTYAERLEESMVTRSELDTLTARLDGLRSGVILRLIRIERMLTNGENSRQRAREGQGLPAGPDGPVRRRGLPACVSLCRILQSPEVDVRPSSPHEPEAW